MALFSKPPAKKPGPAAGQPRPQVVPGRSPSAREVASHAAKKAPPGGSGRQVEPPSEITVSEGSLIEWASPGQPSFEVAQANPGLCAVLEDAALRFASGHAAKARELLEQGVQTDHDTKLSPLAWLALFDLQQRAGDKAAFDQFSLQYVVQFERSAPVWEATEKPQAPRLAGGYVALTGKLTAAVAAQLEGLKRAMAKQCPEARVDMMSVTGFDDEGARILANALGEARRKKFPLQLQRVEKLKPALDAALKQGREGGEGAWLLSLELLQWANAHAAFEDRAVEYAVTFELSPPSWEPPPTAAKAVAATAAATNGAEATAESEGLCWSGVMAGSGVPQLGRLSEHASGRSVIQVDMTDVERIDFVCAGALLNTINRVEAQRKSVQIAGATPIIRALLLLIGVSPRHFVKKA